jgi:hypothetical protein
VDLVFTREQYLDPDYVRRAAIENFIGHPALYDPDGPPSDRAAELAGCLFWTLCSSTAAIA